MGDDSFPLPSQIDVHQSQAFVDLHGQIKSCDEILETMENLLSIFQTDLGNISTEIQTLQTKSVSMSIQLKNRMAVENHLNDLLEGILVTPQLIRKIYDGEVDDNWLAALSELNSKMYHAKARQGRHIRALKEVGPELERLRIKVLYRGWTFSQYQAHLKLIRLYSSCCLDGGKNSRVFACKDKVVQDTQYQRPDHATFCAAKVQGAESIRNGET